MPASPAAKRARNQAKPGDLPIVEKIRSYKESKYFLNEGGYRKLGLYLARDHDVIVNHKRMYRICKAHGLLLARKRGQRQKLKRICNNRNVTGPDQLWQFDIKYGFIPGENRYFYICGFIDVFTRKLIDYHIGLRCTAADILVTLKSALTKRKIGVDHQLVIRSDNGPQMSSKKFALELEAMPCDHEFIPLATPNKNAFIESFFSVLECALLAKSYFMTYGEAYEEVAGFIEFYNHKRIHGVTKMSPHDLELAWQQSKLDDSYAISA